MSDHFADRYFAPGYWPTSYFQGGDQNPGAMRAALSGSGALVAVLEGVEAASVAVEAGGDSGDGLWWRSPRKKKTKGRANKRPAAAQLKSGESLAPQPVPTETVLPTHLDQLKANIAAQVDELLREANKQARAEAPKAKKQAPANREKERQRLAEEALAARMRAIDEDDAILLAMSL